MMTLRRLLLCCLPLACLLAGLLPATSARAATDTVTSTADDGSAGTLRAVLAAAAPGDTVVFGSGVTGTITLTSTLTIAQNVTLTGPGAGTLALSGGGNVEVLDVTGSGVGATIGGLTIEDGAATSGNVTSGGGVLVDNHAALTLTGCVVTGNSASSIGGGVFVHIGALTMTDCAVTGNTSAQISGGVGLALDATATLTNCVFSGNTANINGGGFNNNGTATLTNCAFTGNAATTLNGGAVFNTGTLTLTGCTATGNTAAGTGGGLDNASSTTTLVNDIFYGDTGGEVTDAGGSVTASHCDINETLATGGVTDNGGNIDANPAFVTAGTDLHLQATSPCIGAGTAAGAPATDMDGRSFGSSPAIGAFAAPPSGAYALVAANTSDGVPQSLRAEAQCADDYPDAAITFDPTAFATMQTITESQGTLTLSAPMTLTGPSAGVTVSGPGSAGTYGVLVIANTTGQVNISGLTITHGNYGNGLGTYSGGGVGVSSGASVSLTDCTITGNDAAALGGGLYNDGSATLRVCTITSNVANEFGGGLYNDTGASLFMDDCFITKNGADASQYGQDTGAGALENLGTVTMNNCVVSQNTAFSGYGGSEGGILNYGAMTINGSSFTANGADGPGGALTQSTYQNNAPPSLTLTNDIFYGDVYNAAIGGNAELNIATGTATASYCDIGEALGTGTGGDGVTDGGHNINANPDFEAAPGNLQIGRTSPCLGAGTTSSPEYTNVDILLQTRPTPPSIGAYDATELGNGSTADTLTLASSANPSVYGQASVITATLTPTNSGGVAPTGTVTFTVNGTAGSPVALAANGTATLNTSTDAPGTYTITAAYSGDANYVAAGPTAALTQTITKAAPTITFTESPNPATTGQYFTLTATVIPPAGQASGAAGPTGTVTINGYQQGLVNGVATLQQSYYQPQSVTATATYNGDANYAGVTATPVQFQVTGNDIYGTSVSVTGSPEPSAVGQPVTFTATLAAIGEPSGTPAPTGSLTFQVDPGIANPPAPVSVPFTPVNGQYQAAYTATGLTAGQHQIEVTYAGDSNYGSSGSGTQLQVVYSGTTATTTTLAPATTSVAVGSPVTITATVSPSPGAGGLGSGDYLIFTVDGQQSQFETPLTNGTAAYTSSSLTPGAHTISAIFSGDSTYAGSVSNTANVTITGGVSTPTVSVASSANPSAPGASVTFTASVFASSGAPTPTGTVSFYLGTTPNAPTSNTPFDTETLTNGQAVSAPQTFSTTGTEYIFVSYGGDTNDNPAFTPTGFAQVVSSSVNTGGTTTPTTTLVTSPTPTNTTGITAGQSATITVAVTPATVAGTVTVTLTPQTGSSGPTSLTATETASGSGSYTVTTPTTLAAGVYTVSAAFAPANSAAYTGSQQTGGNLTVSPASTTPPALLNTFQPGLQMAALDETYTSFAEALNNVGTPPTYDTYNGSAYVLSNSATEAAPTPGTGFWIAPGSSVNVYNTGTAATGTVTVSLNQGWNIIGDPFSTAFSLSGISVGGVTGLSNANADGLVYGTLYTYGPSNANAYTVINGTASGASLQPFTGYWLYAFQPGETLTFPAAG